MTRDHRVFLDATWPHLDAIHSLARNLAPDAGLAEDLVQETYLRAFAGFGRHRLGRSDTRSWLVAICLNTARSEARRAKRRPPEALDPSAGTSLPAPWDTSDQVLTSLDRQAVRDALAKLSEPHRLCVVMMDIAGLTSSQTAGVLGCPRGTVLARVHRGRRHLARLLDQLQPGKEVDRGSS